MDILLDFLETQGIIVVEPVDLDALYYDPTIIKLLDPNDFASQLVISDIMQVTNFMDFINVFTLHDNLSAQVQTFYLMYADETQWFVLTDLNTQLMNFFGTHFPSMLYLVELAWELDADTNNLDYTVFVEPPPHLQRLTVNNIPGLEFPDPEDGRLVTMDELPISFIKNIRQLTVKYCSTDDLEYVISAAEQLQYVKCHMLTIPTQADFDNMCEVLTHDTKLLQVCVLYIDPDRPDVYTLFEELATRLQAANIAFVRADCDFLPDDTETEEEELMVKPARDTAYTTRSGI